MKAGILSCLGFLFLVCFSGCKKSLKPADYYQWSNNPKNVLSKWQYLKYYNFNVVYRPLDFMALSQLKGEKLSFDAFKEARKGFECCRHFMIKIYAKDTSDVLRYKLQTPEEYYERVRYLSSEMGKYLTLVEGNDTLACSFFHYERTYKMQPYATVMAFFERKQSKANESKSMRLLLDRGGFNPDKLEFNFTEKELEQIPQLSF